MTKPAVPAIIGFETVFNKAEFHEAHTRFLDERGRKTLDDFLNKMEIGFGERTLNPGYIYNEIVLELRRERTAGSFLAGVSGLVAGAGAGAAAYGIAALATQDTTARGLIAAMAGLAAATGVMFRVSTFYEERAHFEALEKAREELQRKYNNGRENEPEMDIGRKYATRYSRAVVFELANRISLHVRDDFQLLEPPNLVNPVFSLVVENGIPKHFIVRYQEHRDSQEHYDISAEGTRINLRTPMPLGNGSDMIRKYLDDIKRYVKTV